MVVGYTVAEGMIQSALAFNIVTIILMSFNTGIVVTLS